MKTGRRTIGVAWIIVSVMAGACEERAPKQNPAPPAAPTQNPAPLPPTPVAPAVPAATGATGATGAPAAPKAAAEKPRQWDTNSGVIVEEIKVGEGAEVTKFDTVKLQYVGTLANGREFDSSYRRNEPMVVNVGTGMIIKGWKDGIPGMKAGGKRRLTIPPELGYGKTGHPPSGIPPDAMLVFEIEVLEIVK